jgi:hypothetical protein
MPTRDACNMAWDGEAEVRMKAIFEEKKLQGD